MMEALPYALRPSTLAGALWRPQPRASTTISYPVKNLTNQRFLEHCIALQLRSWGHALLIMVHSGVQMSLQAQRCNGHHDNGQVVERQSGHA